MANESSKLGSISTTFNPNTKTTKCTWILNQDDLMNIENKQYVKSDDFETNEDYINATWYLHCYPKGFDMKHSGQCQMFLYLSSLPNIYKSITIYYYMRYMKHNASWAYPCTFTKSGDGTGWYRS
eukprot:527787_1